MFHHFKRRILVNSTLLLRQFIIYHIMRRHPVVQIQISMWTCRLHFVKNLGPITHISNKGFVSGSALPLSNTQNKLTVLPSPYMASYWGWGFVVELSPGGIKDGFGGICEIVPLELPMPSWWLKNIFCWPYQLWWTPRPFKFLYTTRVALNRLMVHHPPPWHQHQFQLCWKPTTNIATIRKMWPATP